MTLISELKNRYHRWQEPGILYRVPESVTRYQRFFYVIGSDIVVFYYDIGGHSDIGICTYIGVCSDIGTDIGDYYRSISDIGILKLVSIPSGAPVSDRCNDPDDESNDPSDREMDADNQRDFLDQNLHVPPTSSAKLRPYARFLADMPDWTEMSEDYYIKALKKLPLPMAGLVRIDRYVKHSYQLEYRIRYHS